MLLILWEALHFSPALLLASAMLLLLAVLGKNRDDAVVYLLTIWAIPIFTWLLVFKGVVPTAGHSFLWLVPAGMILSAVSSQYLHAGYRGVFTVASTFLMCMTVVTVPVDGLLQRNDPMPERLILSLTAAPDTIRHIKPGEQLQELKQIAAYLNEQQPGRNTMVDASTGSGILFLLNQPNSLMLATNYNLRTILTDTTNHIDQILVPAPTTDAGGRSEILKQYPYLYERGAPWARLEKEFDGPSRWRLFEVINPARQKEIVKYNDLLTR
jgi:hypothetical protein